MIWIILYVICTAICCGIILYVNDLSFYDHDLILAVMCSIIWPVFLVIAVLYILGNCVRFLLTKIIKNK